MQPYATQKMIDFMKEKGLTTPTTTRLVDVVLLICQPHLEPPMMVPRKGFEGPHDSPKGSILNEKAKMEVSPPAPGKTTDSKTKAHKGFETKVNHSKTHPSRKSNEKVIIVPGDHHGKSKSKHKPKSADNK